MLDPIDFLQLYRKGQEEAAANGDAAAEGENAIN
jgi:preprotein translocase subunit SecB